MVHTNIPRHDLIKKPEVSLAELVKTTESLFTQHNLQDLHILRKETKYGDRAARDLKFHVHCSLPPLPPTLETGFLCITVLEITLFSALELTL